MSDQIVAGTRSTIPFSFFDNSGVYIDPAGPIVVKFQRKIPAPAGVVYAYTFGVGADIAREGTGQYYIRFIWPEGGLWRYSIKATGDVVTLAEQFDIYIYPADPA